MMIRIKDLMCSGTYYIVTMVKQPKNVLSIIVEEKWITNSPVTFLSPGNAAAISKHAFPSSWMVEGKTLLV